MALIVNVKTKREDVLPVNTETEGIYMLYINNKTERFSFKSTCVVWVIKYLKNTGS